MMYLKSKSTQNSIVPQVGICAFAVCEDGCYASCKLGCYTTCTDFCDRDCAATCSKGPGLS